MSDSFGDFLNTTIIGGNYCIYVDQSFDSILDMKNVSMTHLVEPNLAISSVLIAIALISLTIGSKIFKVVAALVAGLSTFYCVYKISDNSEGISCDARILISLFLGFIIALITGCLINLALFIIGASSLIVLVHMTFSAFPSLHTIYDTAQILNKSLIYWGFVLIAGVLGGFLFRWNKTLALEITTSIIGSISLTYGLFGIIRVTNAEIHNAIYFGIAVVSTGLGIFTQRKLRKRKLCKRRSSTSEIEITNRR